MPKRDKSKRFNMIITDEDDALLTKTAYHLSSPERLVSKSEVVRMALERFAQEVEAERALRRDQLESAQRQVRKE